MWAGTSPHETGQSLPHAVMSNHKLATGQLTVLIMALMATGIGQSLVFAILAPLGREVALSELQITSIIAVSALVFALASPHWGRLSDRVGRKPIIITGLLGYTAGTLVFTSVFYAGLSGLLAGTLFYGIALLARCSQALIMSATNPAATAYAADNSSTDHRTRTMAKLGTANSLGTILGPAVSGALATFGLLAPLYFAAALAASAALLVWRQLPPTPQRDLVPRHLRVRLRFTDPPVPAPAGNGGGLVRGILRYSANTGLYRTGQAGPERYPDRADDRRGPDDLRSLHFPGADHGNAAGQAGSGAIHSPGAAGHAVRGRHSRQRGPLPATGRRDGLHRHRAGADHALHRCRRLAGSGTPTNRAPWPAWLPPALPSALSSGPSAPAPCTRCTRRWRRCSAPRCSLWCWCCWCCGSAGKTPGADCILIRGQLPSRSSASLSSAARNHFVHNRSPAMPDTIPIPEHNHALLEESFFGVLTTIRAKDGFAVFQSRGLCLGRPTDPHFHPEKPAQVQEPGGRRPRGFLRCFQDQHHGLRRGPPATPACRTTLTAASSGVNSWPDRTARNRRRIWTRRAPSGSSSRSIRSRCPAPNCMAGALADTGRPACAARPTYISAGRKASPSTVLPSRLRTARPCASTHCRL